MLSCIFTLSLVLAHLGLAVGHVARRNAAAVDRAICGTSAGDIPEAYMRDSQAKLDEFRSSGNSSSLLAAGLTVDLFVHVVSFSASEADGNLPVRTFSSVPSHPKLTPVILDHC
jgi:hypothetical protein